MPNHRLASVEVDEGSLSPASADIDHERQVAVRDLLADNVFRPCGVDRDGPYGLRLAQVEGRLVLTVTAGEGEKVATMPVIGPALSFNLDVTRAKTIRANAKRGCYQGQTHGHKGFLMKADAAKLALSGDKSGKLKSVLRPFMIATDLIAKKAPAPGRFVIDFTGLDVLAAQGSKAAYKQVENRVLPDRQKAAKVEADRNANALKANPKAKVNRHHANFLNRWWIMSYPREDMVAELSKLRRYIVCGRVTKRPIFSFLNQIIRPNDALQVFAFDDDYSFGILQSDIHWRWFMARCSTLKSDFRYTSNTVWDSFPWPQAPTLKSTKAVAEAAVELRQVRTALMAKHERSLRELYRSLELPGDNPLKAAQAKLDGAVRATYGMPAKVDPLQFLLALNGAVAKAEASGAPVQAPGLPTCVKDRAPFVTDDAIRAG